MSSTPIKRSHAVEGLCCTASQIDSTPHRARRSVANFKPMIQGSGVTGARAKEVEEDAEDHHELLLFPSKDSALERSRSRVDVSGDPCSAWKAAALVTNSTGVVIKTVTRRAMVGLSTLECICTRNAPIRLSTTSNHERRDDRVGLPGDLSGGRFQEPLSYWRRVGLNRSERTQSDAWATKSGLGGSWEFGSGESREKRCRNEQIGVQPQRRCDQPPPRTRDRANAGCPFGI